MVYQVKNVQDLSTQIREALDDPLVVGFINPEHVGSSMSKIKCKVQELEQSYQNVRFIFAVVDETTEIGQYFQVDPSPFYIISPDFFFMFS